MPCYSVISSCFNQSWHRRKKKWIAKKSLLNFVLPMDSSLNWISRQLLETFTQAHTHTNYTINGVIISVFAIHFLLRWQHHYRAVKKKQFTKSFGILAFNLMPERRPRNSKSSQPCDEFLFTRFHHFIHSDWFRANDAFHNDQDWETDIWKLACKMDQCLCHCNGSAGMFCLWTRFQFNFIYLSPAFELILFSLGFYI